MKYTVLVLGALLVFCAMLPAQTHQPLFSTTITVKDNLQATPKVLTFGVDTSATDGIDAAVGEGELPPLPPTGVFDARFVGKDISISTLGNGVDRDIRQGAADLHGTRIHEISYQPNTSATSVTIAWNLPSGVTGLLQDFFGGVLYNKAMTGADSLVVTNLALTTLKMTITYALVPPAAPDPPALTSPADNATGVVTNPQLQWNASANATMYHVQVAANSGFSPTILDSTGLTATSIQLSGLQSSTQYYWRVAAGNGTGWSSYTAAVSFTTAAPVVETNVALALKVQDNLQATPTTLYVGLYSGATDGIDTAYGESELPPLPPTGIFDARLTGTNISLPQLGNGVQRDFRQGSSATVGTRVHQISYQINSGATSVTISWDLPTGITGTIQDFFGGVVYNKVMSGKDSLVVTNTAITTLKVTLNYTGTPLPVTIYVNGTTGNDANDGSSGSPVKTVGRGMTLATDGGTVQVAAGTFTESVNVSKPITLSGAGITTIFRTNGVSVTSNGVTLQNFKVMECEGSGISGSGMSNLHIDNVVTVSNGSNGISLSNASNLVISNVTASSNGSGNRGFGITIAGITGTSSLTNVIASYNKCHGIVIGNSSSFTPTTDGVVVNGAILEGNGVAGDTTTGCGIAVYNRYGTVQNITIKGRVEAKGNVTYGIAVSASEGIPVSNVSVGIESGSTVEVYNNGRVGILVYGQTANTRVSAKFVRGTATYGVGFCNIGTDATGTHEPTGTVLQNSKFNGYTAENPAVTLADWYGRVSVAPITATNNQFEYMMHLKALLEAPYAGGGLMNTTLTDQTLLPVDHPYAGAPFNHTGAERVGSAALFATNMITDWIMVELRKRDSATVLYRTAALLRKDGLIVDTTGTAMNVTLTLASGYDLDLYVVLMHTNHIAVMSAQPVPTASTATYDFTTGTEKYFGGDAKNIGGVYVLYGGDCNQDGFIDISDFIEADNNQFASGYFRYDSNMDGFVDISDFILSDNSQFVGTYVPPAK